MRRGVPASPIRIDAAVPFRLVASYINGQVIGSPDWPSWTPVDLREAGR